MSDFKTPPDPDSDETRISNDKTRVIETPPPSPPTVTESTNAKIERLIDNSHTIGPKIGPGCQLKDRFDLLEEIGSGGMGKVYKALDRRDIEAGNTRFIAIKLINDEYKNDPNLLKALHTEARRTQSLSHANIVTVFDFDRDHDIVFMTMEYIDGVPLDTLIRSNPDGLPVQEALDIIKKIAEALAFAHSVGIIHSDLKPGNILITNKKQVKVYDFGIARATKDMLSRSFDPGILGGLTPSYASLEMIHNDPPDPKDDIYALGCIAYQLFSGQHPFNKLSADVVWQKKLQPKKLSNLSNAQWQTLASALSLTRQERIRDVPTFIDGLSQTSPTFSIAKLWPVVVVIAGLSAGGYWYWQQNNLPVQPQQLESQTAVSQPVQTPEPTRTEQVVATPQETPVSEPEKTSSPSPQWQGNVDLWVSQTQYHIGEQLQFGFTVNEDMYVKIMLVNSEQQAMMIFPNPYRLSSFCKAGIEYRIPPENAEFSLNIEGPAGTDRIIALGSKTPIPDSVFDLDNNGQFKAVNLNDSLTQTQIDYVIE